MIFKMTTSNNKSNTNMAWRYLFMLVLCPMLVQAADLESHDDQSPMYVCPFTTKPLLLKGAQSSAGTRYEFLGGIWKFEAIACSDEGMKCVGVSSSRFNSSCRTEFVPQFAMVRPIAANGFISNTNEFSQKLVYIPGACSCRLIPVTIRAAVDEDQKLIQPDKKGSQQETDMILYAI